MAPEPSILQLILDRLNDIDDHNKQILIQTTKTNGSVENLKLTVYGDGEEGSGLVKRMNKQEHWRSRIKGVLIALSVLWTIVSVAAGIYFSLN